MFQAIFSAMARIVNFMSSVSISIGGFSVSLLDIELAFLVLYILMGFIFPQGGDDE